MGILDTLAEAHVRDWQRRGRPSTPGGVGGPTPNLETQLFTEILCLREAAEAAEAADAARHRRRALDLQVQLCALLERSGRPLAAQQLGERISRALAGGGQRASGS